MSAHLFNAGEFRLHSGGISPFKIDCDALTDEDYEALALWIGARFRYRNVVGIPSGGLNLADACRRWQVPSIELPTLIVDDVFTTGASMDGQRTKLFNRPCIGVVIFARRQPPSWVHPIFQFTFERAVPTGDAG